MKAVKRPKSLVQSFKEEWFSPKIYKMTNTQNPIILTNPNCDINTLLAVCLSIFFDNKTPIMDGRMVIKLATRTQELKIERANLSESEI